MRVSDLKQILDTMPSGALVAVGVVDEDGKATTAHSIMKVEQTWMFREAIVVIVGEFD